MSVHRVLIINSSFPPGGRVKVYRSAKFGKYLPEFGWEPLVLTINEGDKLSKGEFSEELEQIKKVFRTSVFLSGSNSTSLDDGLRWIPNLAMKCKTIIEQEDIDVIFHSGPPFLPFVSTYLCSNLTGVPYILDLRDPWSVRLPHVEPSYKKKIYSVLTKTFEPTMLSGADRVIMNSPKMKEVYSKKYPKISDGFVVIPNGFDECDYDITPTQSLSPHIVYPGKFRDDMRYFFNEFQKLLIDIPDLKFIHYGRKDYSYAPEVRSVVDELNLNENVQFRGYQNRSNVISAILSSEIGLAVTRPGDETHIPSKLYEYMGCDIPIICVDSKTGATHSILKDIEGTFVVSREEPRMIGEKVREVLDENISNLSPSEEVRKFTRVKQTQKLSQQLNDVIN